MFQWRHSDKDGRKRWSSQSRGEMWWWRGSLRNPAPLRHLRPAGRSMWTRRRVRVRDLLAGLSSSLSIIRRRKARRAVVSHYAICTIKICLLDSHGGLGSNVCYCITATLLVWISYYPYLIGLFRGTFNWACPDLTLSFPVSHSNKPLSRDSLSLYHEYVMIVDMRSCYCCELAALMHIRLCSKSCDRATRLPNHRPQSESEGTRPTAEVVNFHEVIVSTKNGCLKPNQEVFLPLTEVVFVPKPLPEHQHSVVTREKPNQIAT